MTNVHVPVLSSEVCDLLSVTGGGLYIDATLGGGGHTEAILKLGGKVLAIDADINAVTTARESLKKYVETGSLVLAVENFDKINQVAVGCGFNQVSGVIYDLGISSNQLENSGRGLSFKKMEDPLDMRLSASLGVRALDLLSVLGEKDLATIFFKYGQIPNAKRIASEIVSYRKHNEVKTVASFVEILQNVTVNIYKDDLINKAFLALRIAVNGEMESLSCSLPQAACLLALQGKLIVISFNSLEDSIVKQFGKRSSMISETVKPIKPSEKELLENPRSRSALLRCYTRV